jgi:hypothetical protein
MSVNLQPIALDFGWLVERNEKAGVRRRDVLEPLMAYLKFQRAMKAVAQC